MAGFKTHITVSTAFGVGYAAVGYHYGAAPATCLLAGGLCGVSGMLPDLDSDSGVPVREAMAFAAAVAPMMLVERLRDWGLSNEAIILCGAGLYLLIRFVAGEFFKRYTVHRGMWHSIPAAVTVGLLALWMTSGDTFQVRFYKAGAVFLGFMSHLLIDELWAIDFRAGKLRFKKSFGTAMKLFGSSPWANLSVYGKLALMVLIVWNDPGIREQYLAEPDPLRMAERPLEAASQPPKATDEQQPPPLLRILAPWQEAAQRLKTASESPTAASPDPR